jgi:hypothetical protein
VLLPLSAHFIHGDLVDGSILAFGSSDVVRPVLEFANVGLIMPNLLPHPVWLDSIISVDFINGQMDAIDICGGSPARLCGLCVDLA